MFKVGDRVVYLGTNPGTITRVMGDEVTVEFAISVWDIPISEITLLA